MLVGAEAKGLAGPSAACWRVCGTPEVTALPVFALFFPVKSFEM